MSVLPVNLLFSSGLFVGLLVGAILSRVGAAPTGLIVGLVIISGVYGTFAILS